MEPLFEAKALYENEYALYNIYRLGANKYRAQLVAGEKVDHASAAPAELVLDKANGQWQTEDASFIDLVCTLGIEIDVFNHGYGDILGHIGVE